MNFPLAYLDRAAIEEVPIDTWKDVFDALGWSRSLTKKRDALGYDDILNSFAQDEPSDDLLHALEALSSLGTEEGREAIISAINDSGARMGALPTEKGEREFALRFFLAQRRDAALSDAFVRAQIQIQERGNQRRYNEFMGKEARPIKDLSSKKEALREGLLAFCERSDLGNHVQVDAFEDGDIYVFNILRSHRLQKPLAVVPGHSARAPIQFRSVHGDVIRYDSDAGHLRIAARAPTIVEFYREHLGKVLFNDELFFHGDPICSLRVLQEQGRQALENHNVNGIGRVWMTECLWERGDRDLLQLRSTDCFGTMEELRLPLTKGTLVQAKLRCEVVGKSTRPTTVNIRVPSRIEVSQKVHENLIDRLLTAIGIRAAAKPAPTVSLWALSPWRHTADTWRAVFGAETDALAEKRVLEPIHLTAVPHPSHPGAGLVLDAHELPGGDYYGVSRTAEIQPRSLTPTDLDGLELRPEQLRLYLRAKLEITSGGAPWDNGELLELGFVLAGDQRIYAAYALQRPQPGVGDKLRARASGAHLALIFPPPQADTTELPHVTLESALPKRSTLLRQLIFACGLQDSAPVTCIAPDEARLVVDTRLRAAWIDGVEIKGLTSDSHEFKFIELLARHRIISAQDIVAKISPGRQDDTTAARQAKTRAKQLIAKAMANAGRALEEDPFPTAGRGFYRCILQSYVR